MSSDAITQYKCSAPNATYLFDVQGNGDVTLRVVDISQNNLFTKTYSAEVLGPLKITRSLVEKDTGFVLMKLVAEKLLPDSCRPTFFTKVTVETCLATLKEVTSEFKPRTPPQSARK